MRCCIALLMLTALTGVARAQDSERERLEADRRGLVDRFATEERACRERFVVTACVDDLRERRRAALEPLRERELALDDAERQRRANDRQAARATRAARPQPASAAAARQAAEPQTPPFRAAPAVTATLREPDAPRPGDGHNSRALQAAERARAAAKRAEAMDATRAELARKHAERAAHGKAAWPLPLPLPAVASAAAAGAATGAAER